jgi:hypothetical protein
MVESFFRLAKDLLETRPVFHKYDNTIRGHIFCSFLALLLRYELMTRLEACHEKPEWSDVIRDLEALQSSESPAGHEDLTRVGDQGFVDSPRVYQRGGVYSDLLK